jgi:O-antigen/teichoic acid export membrane protein
VIAGAGALLAPFAPGWFSIAGAEATTFSWAFALAAGGLALSLVACGPRAVLQGFQRQTAVGVSLLGSEIASLGCTIALLYLDFGVMAIALGLLARELIHNAINWPLFVATLRRMGLRPTVSARRLRVLLPLVGWTFAGNLGVVLRGSVDAFVVAKAFDNSTVVVTEYSKRIWELATQLLGRATSSFTPALAHLHGGGERERFRSVSARLLAAVALALSLALGGVWAFNADFVALWVGSANWAGAGYNLAWGAAALFNVLVLAMTDVLFAAGGIRGTAAVQVLQTAVRLLLLVGTVSWLGILALPLSALAAAALGGVPWLALRWKRLLGLSAAELWQQARPLLVGAGLAAALAAAWTAWVPGPLGWLALAAQAAAFAALLGLALAAVEPSMRALAAGGVAALGRRVARRTPR